MDLRRKTGAAHETPKLVILVGIAGLLIAVAAASWGLLAKPARGLDTSRYQLVTLSSGEHYIGKLSRLGDEYAVLSDVYYQQEAADTSTKTPAKNQQITVLRLSDAVAKPDNTMHIAKDKIVHWENVSNDSKIIQAIKQSQ